MSPHGTYTLTMACPSLGNHMQNGVKNNKPGLMPTRSCSGAMPTQMHLPTEEQPVARLGPHGHRVPTLCQPWGQGVGLSDAHHAADPSGLIAGMLERRLVPTPAPPWTQPRPLCRQDTTPACGTSVASGTPHCSLQRGCSVPLAG